MKRFLLALSFLLCIAAIAQPRFTDSTFGMNGKVVENTAIPDVQMVDALLQPDGKMVTLASADYFTTITHTNYYTITRTVLIRYNADGSPDVSFSNDGIADSLIIPGMACHPEAMRLQPDGKILVCGSADDLSEQKAFVTRYNADGSLDTSFAGSGILYLPTFIINGVSSELSSIEDITVLPDGRITLLPNRSYPYYDITLVRLNSNGTVDRSFGTNGISIVNPLSSSFTYQRYTHLEVLSNGKYIVGGNPNTTSSSGTNQTYVLVRINANGTIDNTYGTNGVVQLTGGPTSDGLEDMVVQPDGKVIVGGSENLYSTHTYVCLHRLTAAGMPDATFGNGGKQIVRTLATGLVVPKVYLYLQADGKILIGGRARNSSGNYTMAVARLTATSLFDTSFDNDGVALLQVNDYNSYGYIPLQQNDGKVVVAGLICSPNPSLLSIGRFTSTGQTDASLNAAMTATVLHNGSSTEGGVGVMLQPTDQKIISVRERSNGFDFDVYVSRHLPNGQPDLSFGTNGKTYLSIPGYLFYTNYSGLSANGKITVVAYFLNFTTYDSITYGTLGIFRLRADGRPDSSFGQYGKIVFESRTTDTVIESHTAPTMQPDGKIIVVARRYKAHVDGTALQDSSFLLRLNNDGSYDNTFRTNRKSYSTSQSIQLALQPDGKILLAKTDYVASETYVTRITRLNVDGSIDVTFNNGTDRVLNFQLLQIAVQSNGKIILGGQNNTVNRLLNNGSSDTTFGVNGTVDVTGYYGVDGYNSLTIDSSHILLLGNLQNSTAPYYSVPQIVALKSNGLPDSTFGQSGVGLPNFLPNGYGYQTVVQADGKIVMTGSAGTTDNPHIGNFTLTRLKANNLTTTGRLYTFTGSGLWSNPANWADGTVPPTTIPAGNSVVIDPPTGSECVIDITVHVQTGASVTIKAGKKVRLPGNLLLQ